MSTDTRSPNSTYLPCAPNGSINLTRSNDLSPVNYWDCGRQYGQYSAKKNAVRRCLSDDLRNQIDNIGGIWYDSDANVTYTDMKLHEFLQNVAPIASENNLSVVNVTSDIILSDFIPVSNSTPKINLFKRDVVCTFYTWTQTQAAQKGDWWSPWYPSSCWVWNGKGNGASYTIAYGWSYSWSIDSSSGIGSNALSASFPGFTLSKTYTRQDSTTCQINGDVDQVWYQQHMVWADMQKKSCCYQAGSKGIWCGAWSQYYRANAPLKDSYAVGCSVRQQNVDCDAKNLRCSFH